MRKNTIALSKHFVLHELAEGVFAAIAEDGGSAICNSGMIDLGGQILVFDTFMTPQAATDLRKIATNVLGHAPQIVINSHYHNDHIWGNQVFLPEAQIISSTRTCALIATTGAEEYQRYAAEASQRLESLRAQVPSTDNEKQERSMSIVYYEGLVEALPQLKVCMPGITFDNRLEIHGTQQTAELKTIERAHTENDTVLHLPKDGIMFMGDILFVGCHPYLADGDPDQLLKALREFSHIGVSYFVPGHGPIGTIQDIRSMIEYIETCMETAQALVDKGEITEDKIKELMIPAQYFHWKLPRFWQINIRFLCERLNSAKGK